MSRPSKAWRVILNQCKSQDGMEGEDVPYFFDEYDDAHRFYAFMKAYKGPYAPWVAEPPTPVVIPMPKVYKKGELTSWEQRDDD